MKKYLFLLIAMSLLITPFSCKKYEDGPLLTLKTKKGRIDGRWNLVLVYSNDEDVTQYQEPLELVFDKNGNFKEIRNNGPETTGTWEFNDDKTQVRVFVGNSPDPFVYDILRLTNSQLWWKRVVNLDVTEYHFEVIK